MSDKNIHRMVEELEQTIAGFRAREYALLASLSALNVLSFIVDEDGQFVDVPTHVQSSLLYHQGVSIAKSIYDAFPSQVADLIALEIKLALELDQHRIIDSEISDANKSRRLRGRVVPLGEYRNDRQLLTLVLQDVTSENQELANPDDHADSVNQPFTNERKLSNPILGLHKIAFELLESIGEPFYGLDQDWRFVYLNQKAEQLWGRNRDELIGKNIWEEFPHAVGTESYKKMHRAFKDRCAIRFETSSSSLNAWTEVEVYPTANGLSVYYHDRTRRKKAEKALRESEEKFRDIVEIAQEGICMIDNENRTTFVNPMMSEMLGYSVEEILGASIFDFMDESGKAITEKSIKMGGLKTKGLHEFSFKRKDNSIFHTLLSKTPLIDDTGNYVGALAMLIDISDRKQTSDAQAQLAAIVNSSGDAIISMTLQGIITSWNVSAEEIYGYSVQEVLGQSVNLLIPQERWEEEETLLQRVASGETILNHETLRTRKDAVEVFISVTVSPIFDSNGNIVGVSKIARDITNQRLTERQLRESEESFKHAQRLAHIGNWTWQVQINRLKWSDEMYHIFGIAKDSFSGDLSDVIKRAIHPDDRAAVERANALVAQNETPASLEYRVVWPDGTIRYVRAEVGDLILDSAGKPSVLTGIVQDITERKQAQIIIQESEERYRTLFETMKQGVLYHDHTGVITAANPAIQNILGLTLEQLQSIKLIFDQNYKVIHEDGSEFPIETRPAMLALRSGRPVYNVILGLINPARGEHRWVLVNAIPQFRSGEAAPYQVYVTIDDITERQQMLHQLQNRERTLALSLKAARAGVWSWDIEGKSIAWDKQMEIIHGFSPGSFGGTFDEWQNVVYPEDLKVAVTAIQDALAGREPFDTEFRVVRPDGTIRHVSGQAIVVLDHADQPTKMIGVNIDITDRKNSEQEVLQLNTELEHRVRERTAHLSAVNQELEAFSYSVSHDLRAPLRAIDGFSQAILEDYYDDIDDMGKDFLNRIRNESQRMGRLIDDLIALSRYTRSDMQLQTVNLSEIAHETLQALKQSDPDRDVAVSIQEDVIVEADYSLMQVVMQNLLSNAWKYSAKNPQAYIEFGRKNQGDACEYYVKDNGAGFDMAYVHKLFGAFQRLHGMDEFEGTGIGLATVKRIVHRHGGTVRAEGEINKGATILFTLVVRHINK